MKFMSSIDIKKNNTILNIDGDNEEEGDIGVVTRKRFKRPSRYKVLLHNDDYTTMEFVVYVLKNIFGKGQEEAMGIMLEVHSAGHGVCGIYTHEIAETKTKRVVQEAKENGHPLLCTMEKE